MSKWLSLLLVGCVIMMTVNSSPVVNGNDSKVSKPKIRQQSNGAANSVTAATAGSASPAPEDDDDEEEDDDDTADDDGEENESGTTGDDDDDDYYDFERILEDILGGGGADDDDDDDDEEDDNNNNNNNTNNNDNDDDDDDDEDGEEGENETKPESVSAAPQAIVTAAAVATQPPPVQGLSASPSEEVEQPAAGDQATTSENEDQLAEENSSHTVTLLTNSQPEDADDPQEQILNTNNIAASVAANYVPASAAAASSTSPAPADEEEDEDDEDDDDALGDEVDEDDEEEEEEGRKARGMGTEMSLPTAYIDKYNQYVDSIFGRINKVLQKHYNPVNVRLQSAPATKKKTVTPTKSAAKIRKKPLAASSNRADDSKSPHNETISISSGTLRQSRVLRKKKHSTHQIKAAAIIPKWFRCLWSIMDPKMGYLGCSVRTNKESKRDQLLPPSSSPLPLPTTTTTTTTVKTLRKTSTKKSTVRAKATLYGLSSLRRDGDVAVNMLNTYTIVRSKFLVGPLTLKVEKEFTRGTKKEMRSAIATTAEMFGKLNLKVVHGGGTSLNSIKVMQPKQMRVENANHSDKSSDFMLKKSNSLAKVVSQKLADVARLLLSSPNNSMLT